MNVVVSILMAVYGMLLASFVTLVAYRIPLGISIVHPRSHCSSCKHELGIIDLIPVVSYLVSRGKCRYCGVSYGSFHFWMELFISLLFSVAGYVLYGDWVTLSIVAVFLLLLNLNIVSLRVHRVLLFNVNVVVCVVSCVASFWSVWLIGIAFLIVLYILFSRRYNFVYVMQFVGVAYVLLLCLM